MSGNIFTASNFEKSLFIMALGIAGVFLVLILFYFLIKAMTKVFPYKNEQDREEP